MKLNLDFRPLEELQKKMPAGMSDLKRPPSFTKQYLAERFGGADWTVSDEKRLVKLFQEKDESIEEISKTLGRQLNLLKKSWWKNTAKMF